MKNICNNIYDIINKNRQIVLYVVFGIFTTIVNFVVYLILNRQFSVDELLSNSIAWMMAVLFAYVVNKVYVFENVNYNLLNLIIEFTKFMSARAFSGVLDMLILWMGVYQLGMYDVLVKIVTSIVVIVSNYLLSKFWIFNEK